jgi:predicted class III extradiol MEMO1 family dioxygenase
MTPIRYPAVAGRFYPDDPTTLLESVSSYLSPKKKTIPAIGCLAPHAGYLYSGQVAGTVYATLTVPRRCIVLGPNHTGLGHPLSIMTQGSWRTPLGDAPLDADLGNTLKQRFLQVCRPDFTMVPIALGTNRFEIWQSLGESIAEVIAAQAEPVLIIASSDMNHYESDRVTRNKDRLALDRILTLDPRGLFEAVSKEDISMCGLGPAVTMLTSAGRLGATKAELTAYATSGDVSGDREMVVGYAGVIVQ